MDSLIVALYPGFTFVWQSVPLLSTSFMFALLLLSGDRQTGGKLPVSGLPDKKVRFRRKTVIISISEHTNNIAWYISGIPRVLEILLMHIHQTERGYPRIVILGEPTGTMDPITKKDVRDTCDRVMVMSGGKIDAHRKSPRSAGNNHSHRESECSGFQDLRRHIP